jgi:hypothetical protein
MFNFDQILVHRGEAIDDFATVGVVGNHRARQNKKPRPHQATGDF